MTKKWIGIAVPPAVSLAALGLLVALGARADIRNGVTLGVGLALAQSWLSMAAVKRARTMKGVFRVWVAGIVMRLVILLATMWWVLKTPAFNLTATLLSLVTATTAFLVAETYGTLTD